MNILYAILAVGSIVLLIYLGARSGAQVKKIRSNEKLEEADRNILVIFARAGRWGAWAVAAILTAVLVNNFVWRIPNPFELPSASIGDMLTDKKRPPIGPLTTPPTTADPAAAAERERRLLDAAKALQEKDLKK